MVANRTDVVETAGAAKDDPDSGASGNGNGDAKRNKPSGFIAWLPLVISFIAMPLLAYATTSYLLLPKLQKELGPATGAATGTATGAARTKTAAGSKEKGGAFNKTTVQLGRILVNVAGSVGTRYLTSSISVVGTHKEFKERIERSRDQLLDVASSTLGSKTIADLEKPGARNLIRTELITVFNNALGEGVIEEIYITEMAIQ
ncbi:MAG: flagellar basal body-associated FliL family protein [Verrucomicrobiia bacterium]